MHINKPGIKEDMQKRLRRIEGQVRGVQKMIDEGRDCGEIIQQLAAIRAAVQQVNLVLVRSYASQCLHNPGAEPDDVIEDLIGVLSRVP